jgi:hypothetical protein
MEDGKIWHSARKKMMMAAEWGKQLLPPVFSF